MARTTFVDIDPAEEVAFFKGLTSQDRFTLPRISRKISLLSKKRIVGLRQKTFLPAIAELWAGLSAGDRTLWQTAAAASGLTGWQLFVKDKCARIKNDFTGLATPSALHQCWVGDLHIENPASELQIGQYHPAAYWISRKVTNKKAMYEPIKVTEALSLPLTIGLNYIGNLAEVSSPSFARFYAVVFSSYQGVNLQTPLTIELDLSGSWAHAEATLSSVKGYLEGYALYFHLSNVTGDLYFDDVEVLHSSQNWARDPQCNDINQGFTRMFFQVPKHWVAVEAPAGTFFESIYKDF